MSKCISISIRWSPAPSRHLMQSVAQLSGTLSHLYIIVLFNFCCLDIIITLPGITLTEALGVFHTAFCK